jgi:hypothetical protein
VNKMKLSKTAWWILGIGFFILAAIILVVLLSSQSGEAKQLEDNLLVTQTLINKLISDREDMESQLAQLENELEDAQTAYNQSQAKYPESVASIEYDEEIFTLANDSSLEIMSLIAAEPRENKVEDIPFVNTSFDVDVRGTVTNILNFIDDIATGEYFESATVELINLEIPEAGQDEKPTALIKIIIYSYEGE